MRRSSQGSLDLTSSSESRKIRAHASEPTIGSSLSSPASSRQFIFNAAEGLTYSVWQFSTANEEDMKLAARPPPSETGSHHKKPPPPETSLSRIFYKAGPLGPTYRKRFQTTFRYIWHTKQIVDEGTDLELQIQTGLGELLVYVFFILILSFITYGMLPSSLHYVKHGINRKVHQRFRTVDGILLDFDEIRTVADMFQFLNSAFLKLLYVEDWYRMKERVVPVVEDDRNVLYENHLLGHAKLQMVRVRGDTCQIHPSFAQEFRQCFDYYNELTEARDVFVGERENMWIWKGGSMSASLTHGQFGLYSPGGYFQILPEGRDQAEQVFQQLKENVWVTRSTRAVIADFTIYNANVNLFCTIRLLFEIPPTGGVYTSYDLQTVKLLRYLTPWDFFVLGCEFTFILFVFFFLLEEIREAIFFGRGYFKHLWNILDLVIVILTLGCSLFILLGSLNISAEVKDLVEQADQLVNLSKLASRQMAYNQVVAVVLLLCWFKLFKYTEFNRSMTILSQTLQACKGQLFSFALIFTIFYIGFGLFAKVVFGRELHEFSSLKQSFLTQVRILSFNYQTDEMADRYMFLGQLYLITYMICIYFGMMNLGVAILSGAFAMIKSYKPHNPTKLTVIKFLMRGVRKICSCCYLVDEDPITRYWAQKGNKRVKIHELRSALDSANFTSAEIDIFMAKFQIREDAKVSVEEVERILYDVENNIFTPQKPTTWFETITFQQMKIDDSEHKKIRDVPVYHCMTYREYEMLQSRLDLIEIQLELAAERLADAVNMLQLAETQRWAIKRP